MKNLIKAENTIKYLRQKGITAKKGYGQNFLIDENILSAIISGSGINKDSIVLEIGPGMGTLTQALCENAGYVIAVEIDRDMIKYLDENLDGYDNYTVINDDILKVDLKDLYDISLEKISERKNTSGIESREEKDNIKNREEIEKDPGFLVVANLPYYITTPIIMQLLESGVNISSITVMVQKEVADRMKAAAGTKDYGALSLAVQYYAETVGIIDVPGSSFIPRPEVESEVIKLILRENPKEILKNSQGDDEGEKIILTEITEKIFFNLIKAAFSKRRKTFVNAVSNNSPEGLSKDEVRNMLIENGYDENIRGERLSVYDYAKLAEYIYKKAMKA